MKEVLIVRDFLSDVNILKIKKESDKLFKENKNIYRKDDECKNYIRLAALPFY